MVFEKEPFGALKNAARRELESESWLQEVAQRTGRSYEEMGVLVLEFVERSLDEPVNEEPGFSEFLRDRSLSGDASDEEIAFRQSLSFKGKRPTSFYDYRALQNLRDPLHFREV